jgi:hypothetical protein
VKKKYTVRPTKMQSLPGFIVGIIFVLLGIFAVIPRLGAFGIIWTLVAGLITVVNGINVFSEDGIPMGTVITEETEQKPRDNTRERLEKLEGLYRDGLITKIEYEQKRREILNEL